MRVAGTVTPPGDKSITHRALVLGALARGTSTIEGALASGDARSTAGVLRVLGATVSPLRRGTSLRVGGRGLHGLHAPDRSLQCGNSGTAARFMLGVLAGYPFSARLTGDASLSRRPMRRVTIPLTRMGARFEEEHGDGLPLRITGGPLRALEYDSPAASAQVKSALLFAGLVGEVPVMVREPVASRDHTERMLRALGVPVESRDRQVRFGPVSEIPGFELRVPADPSSAAFLVGAGVLATAGELQVRDVGLNPTRTGFLRVLERMGARVAVEAGGETLGEPFGTLTARPAALAGTVVTREEIPSLIDEIPILAVLASRAAGETEFHGVGELRVKESDRLALLESNLRALGIEAEAAADRLRVRGSDRPPRGCVETAKDHRLAMAFAVLGTVPGADIGLSEADSVAVSYPGFFEDLRRIRAGA